MCSITWMACSRDEVSGVIKTEKRSSCHLPSSLLQSLLHNSPSYWGFPMQPHNDNNTKPHNDDNTKRLQLCTNSTEQAMLPQYAMTHATVSLQPQTKSPSLVLTGLLCGTEQYGRAASACGGQQYCHAARAAASLQAAGASHRSPRRPQAGLHQARCLRCFCGKPSFCT